MNGIPGQEEEEDDREPMFGNQSDQDDQDDPQQAGDESLYAILNLARDCSQEDIQKAYKRLAVLLHPDRHNDPALKQAADSRFQALNRAYSILSDERSRAIYDTLGQAGLDARMQVGQKFKSAQELRDEFAKMSAKQRQTAIENLVKSKGEITCTTDAQALFLSRDQIIMYGGPEDMTFAQKLATVRTRQLLLRHSFTTEISPRTSLTTITQLLTKQGSGGGNMILKLIHRPASTTSIELGTTVLRPRLFTFKATYQPEPASFATFEFPIRTMAAPPHLSATIGRRVSPRVVSTFSLRSGNYSLFGWGVSPLVSDSTFTLSFIHDKGHSIAFTGGVLASQVNAEYVWTVYRSIKVRASASVTTMGAIGTSVGADGKVTEFVRAGFGLDTGADGSMIVKLRLMRLGQRINVPIIVASRFSGPLALSLTVVPSLAVIGAQHFFIQPRKKRKLAKRVQDLRKENEELIAKRRKEAEDAVQLLREHAERKQQDERRKNGLVIDEAWYGVLDSSGDDKLDVTVAMASLVQSSQLIIPGGRSKSHLLGFFDCAMGSRKRLRVRYTFKGRPHETTVGDTEALALPVRAHLVE